MVRTKYIILVPRAVRKELVAESGVSSPFVSKALRFDSETSSAQIRVRELAMSKYQGKLVKMTFQQNPTI